MNEAFAAAVLRFQRDLGIDDDRLNVNGGAIALGHPLGATGAMLLGTVLDELDRRDGRYGLVTLCVGGGMGVATVVERLAGTRPAPVGGAPPLTRPRNTPQVGHCT